MNIVRERLAFWASRAKSHRQRLEATGGLKRYEWWELEYFEAPYLTLASSDFIHRRFIDHFHNIVRLNKIGQLTPVPQDEDEHRLLLPIFTHLNLEINTRGRPSVDLIKAANSELDKYFVSGPPTGVSLFSTYPESLPDVIVKFSQHKFLDRMIELGEIRMTPASHYAKGSLLKAQKDLETDREFLIDASAEALDGQDHVLVGGRKVKIRDGFASLTIRRSDYLLWSACLDIDRRLPTDFDCRAAIIIRDPIAFKARLEAGVQKCWPGSRIWHGPVQYYDPCSFAARKFDPMTIKHFSYFYQREWRLCAVPSKMPSEPQNILIGSLADIADVVAVGR